MNLWRKIAKLHRNTGYKMNIPMWMNYTNCKYTNNNQNNYEFEPQASFVEKTLWIWNERCTSIKCDLNECLLH